MRCSKLAVKLLQCEENGAEAAEAGKGGVEDEEEENGQSLEASNEQDGRDPGQHEDGDEQGWTEGFHLSIADGSLKSTSSRLMVN